MRNNNNYFEGKYTVNSNIVLRRSFLKYSIYNIDTDVSSDISFALYSVLSMFMHNSTNLVEVAKYFRKNNIELDYEEIQKKLSSRIDFSDLLIKSNVPFEISNPYFDFTPTKQYEHTPESVDLLITNRCNLHCPHCYRNSTSKDSLKKINTNRLFELIDEMEDMRVRSLKITGGEAFLVDELLDIVTYVSQKRMHISILTNATIPLSDKWLNVLSNSNITLGVSLDGVIPFTNDKIRGKGSFEKTYANLLKLKEFNARFNITFTVNQNNFDEIDKMTILAKELGARTLMFNFIEESGRAINNKSLYDKSGFNKNEIKKKISLLEKQESTIRITIVDNHGLAYSDDELKIIKDKKDLIICKAGFASFALDAELNVSPCIYGLGGKKEYIVDNLSHKSISEVWGNEKFNIFRGGIKINDLPKCKNCSDKDICNLKYCRLRPIYEGGSIYDSVSFCNANL